MDGVKQVTRYMTADGKEANSEQQAERNHKDLLCRKMEQFIDTLFQVAHRPSVIKAVNTLVDNPTVTKAQLKELLFIMSFGDEGE